jgi:hypothetical protein
MDAIEALEPAAVGYVSCNPVAMARDLKRWVAKGWTLGPVTPFDMFPHTAHRGDLRGRAAPGHRGDGGPAAAPRAQARASAFGLSRPPPPTVRRVGYSTITG